MEGTNEVLEAIFVQDCQDIQIIFNEIRDSAFGQGSRYILIKTTDSVDYPTFIENNRIQMRNLNSGSSNIKGIRTEDVTDPTIINNYVDCGIIGSD